MHTLYIYLRAGVTIVATLIILAISSIIVPLLVILSLGLLRNLVIEYYGPLLGRSILALAGVRLKIVQAGEKVQGQAVYISNHSSTLDMFIIIGLGLPRVRFVAKYELLYNPFFFILGKVTDQIFIKRDESEKAIAVLKKAHQYIKKNRLSLYVAPEGTRKHAGVVGPFKKGAFRMALDLGYPIVPIFFEGARDLCEGGSLIVKPGEVIARFHSPIDTSGWTLETLDAHIEEIRKQYIEWEKQASAKKR